MKIYLVLHVVRVYLDFSGLWSQESFVVIKRRSRRHRKYQGWVCGEFQVPSYFLLPLRHSAESLGSSAQHYEMPLRSVAMGWEMDPIQITFNYLSY